MEFVSSLGVERDVSPGHWAVAGVDAFNTLSVGALVPAVFAAYGRVLHPGSREVDSEADADEQIPTMRDGIVQACNFRDVSWAELAAAGGTTVERGTDWESLVEGVRAADADGLDWWNDPAYGRSAAAPEPLSRLGPARSHNDAGALLVRALVRLQSIRALCPDHRHAAATNVIVLPRDRRMACAAGARLLQAERQPLVAPRIMPGASRPTSISKAPTSAAPRRASARWWRQQTSKQAAGQRTSAFHHAYCEVRCESSAPAASLAICRRRTLAMRRRRVWRFAGSELWRCTGSELWRCTGGELWRLTGGTPAGQTRSFAPTGR